MAALRNKFSLLTVLCALLALATGTSAHSQLAETETVSFYSLDIARSACNRYSNFPVAEFPENTLVSREDFSDEAYSQVIAQISLSEINNIDQPNWRDMGNSHASWFESMLQVQSQWQQESGGMSDSRLLARDFPFGEMQLAVTARHGAFGLPLSEITCMVYVPSASTPIGSELADWYGSPPTIAELPKCETESGTEAFQMRTVEVVLPDTGLYFCIPNDAASQGQDSHFYVWHDEEDGDVSTALIASDAQESGNPPGLFYYAKFVTPWIRPSFDPKNPSEKESRQTP
jgi:hypothetical protein